MKTVELTYIGKQWTNGENYDVGCAMCQSERAGLFRMMPLPTIKVRLAYEGEHAEKYLCAGCLDRGIKAGHLKATNERPKGCQFIYS